MPRIEVFSKEVCPYCVRAKALLDRKNLRYEEIDVEKNPGARGEMERRLGGGHKTVPQIFSDGRYIGDCEGIEALERAGHLDEALGVKTRGVKTRGVAPRKEHCVSESRKVVILGSGPAGYTAALYAGRAELTPLLLAGPQPGGQLTITTDVENYPGFPDGIQGPELMELFRKQAERFGTEVRPDLATGVDLSQRPFLVIKTEKGEIRAEALILATGASAQWLGIPGEQAASEGGYGGRGVSACATCDGFFFRGERIAVAGGGDTAVEEATFLTRFGREVVLIHRRDRLRASKIMQKRAMENPKIKIYWNTVVREVMGDGKKMTGLRLKDVKTGVEREEAFGGFFVAIGHKPNTDFLRGQIDLDEGGYIVLPDPSRTATKIPGVFAAGDARDKTYRQAVTAAGMGCQAAIEAERFLAEHP